MPIHDLSNCLLGVPTSLIYCRGLLFLLQIWFASLCGGLWYTSKRTIDEPKITSLIQWLPVIKHPTCNADTSFSNSWPLCLSHAHWERATGESVMPSKVMTWTSSPGSITEHRKPNPGPLLFMPHQAALQTYPIWPRGFHAHALQDSCSFHGPRCWTRWILERIQSGSIPVPFFPPQVKTAFFKSRLCQV